MNYRLLNCWDDSDIPFILSVYRLPPVSHFISIDEKHYWQYVTSTENVWFYKIFENDCFAATIHLELSDHVMYMSIVVFPEYQKNGIATKILHDIQAGKLGIDFEKIRVSIDRRNIPSIRLFKAAGFVCAAEDGELLEFEYVKN